MMSDEGEHHAVERCREGTLLDEGFQEVARERSKLGPMQKGRRTPWPNSGPARNAAKAELRNACDA